MPLALNYVGSSFSPSKSTQLATVYRCVEVISDALAQLPLYIYRTDNCGHKEIYRDHPSFEVLSTSPNKKYSRFTMVKLIVQSMLLEGGGFVYIERDKQMNPKNLIYLPANLVTVVETPTDIVYACPSIGYVEIPSEDMLAFLNYTEDGVHGISTIMHAAKTLELAQCEEDNSRAFFSNGSNLAGVLSVNAPLTSKQKADIRTSWQQAFNGQGGQSNGVAVLEGNMSYTPITVNPADAELLASRQYSVIEICRFFGVSPVKCFDLSKSSYSTIEATQLSFLTDTVGPLISKLENELNRKLFTPAQRQTLKVEFDLQKLLVADMNTKASYYSQMYNIGVMTPNEIRRELSLPHIEGGDKAMGQVNVTTLENIASGANAPQLANPTAAANTEQ